MPGLVVEVVVIVMVAVMAFSGVAEGMVRVLILEARPSRHYSISQATTHLDGGDLPPYEFQPLPECSSLPQARKG